MKKKLEKLVEDKIINKDNLLLINYKKIGISDKELILLLKIANSNQDVFDVNDLYKLNIGLNEEIDQLVGDLILKKIIQYKIDKKDNEIIRQVNFKLVWVKLLESYFSESQILKTDLQKIGWLINKFGFENTEMIKNNLKNLLKKIEWEKVFELVRNLETRNMLNITFSTFANFLEKDFINNNYDQVLNYDWLEN